jgi:hypothetical protein
MPRVRRLLIMAAVGTFLICPKVLTFHSLDRSLERFGHGIGTIFERAGVTVELASAASKATQQASSLPEPFQWNWRDSQALTAENSLRNTKLTEQRRKAIASAIAGQLRPICLSQQSSCVDVDMREIASEPQLYKAVLNTRTALIDLNADGIPEIVAQGMLNCGATGNCPFWVLRKAKSSYELLLEGEAQTFTIQNSKTNGFHDIVLSIHGSYSSGTLTDYHYNDGAYEEAGCYDYYWTVLEDDKVRKLNEPRITPCSERDR